jgi:hypothetical protein
VFKRVTACCKKKPVGGGGVLVANYLYSADSVLSARRPDLSEIALAPICLNLSLLCYLSSAKMYTRVGHSMY